MRRIKPESIIRVILYYIWSCRFFSQREYISNRYSTDQLKNTRCMYDIPFEMRLSGCFSMFFECTESWAFFMEIFPMEFYFNSSFYSGQMKI